MIGYHYLDPRPGVWHLGDLVHDLLEDVGADAAALYMPQLHWQVGLALALGVSARSTESECLLRTVTEVGTQQADGSRSRAPLFVASTVMAVPVLDARGRALGAVGLASQVRRRWSPADLEAAQGVARAARQHSVFTVDDPGAEART